MKKEEITPRSIEGDWDWRETSAKQADGWATIETKPEGDHIWHFIGDDTMLSTEKEWMRYVVKYRFDPEKLRLSLDGWQLDDKGERESLIRKRYRVEFPNHSELYLYDLEDVAPGEAEALRLRLRKV